MSRSLDTHGGNVWEAARNLSIAPSEIIDFSANINPLGPSPRARDAAIEALASLPVYPDPTCNDLIEAIAAYHQIPTDSILVGNGSTELIYLVARCYGSRTIIPVPSFSDYERSVRVAGGTCRFIKASPSDGYWFDLARISPSLRRGPTLLFIGNPNNPTGQRHAPEKLRALIGKAGRLGINVALDEAFIDFWEEESLVRDAARSRRLLVLRSFTKFFALAELRVGYLVSHPAIIKRLRAVKEPWTVNTLAQAAAKASLADDAYIRESRKKMEEARLEFIRGLQVLARLTVYPSEANFVLVKLPPAISARELSRHLFGRKFLIREAGSFRGLGPRHVRLAVRSPAENRLLLEAMRKIISL